MTGFLTTFGPLIVSLGGFLINLFVKDQNANAQAKENLQAWVNANKNDSLQSAGEHVSYQSQMDELIASLPPEDQAVIKTGGRNLKQGDNGPLVALLQTKLNGRGYTIAIDFEFGPQTTVALNAFKEKNGLPTDGVADWVVWKTLSKEGNP